MLIYDNGIFSYFISSNSHKTKEKYLFYLLMYPLDSKDALKSFEATKAINSLAMRLCIIYEWKSYNVACSIYAAPNYACMQ